MKTIFVIVLLFLVIPFSFSNGIWTYAEDIRAGVFGLNEGLTESDSYTFDNVVYFNRNIFARSNLTVDNTLFTNRIVGIENSIFRIDLREGRISRFSGVVAEVFFSPNSNSFFVVPANTSVLRNVNITEVLTYRGENIEDVFVLEGQPNSITNTMLQNNAVTSSKIAENNIGLRELNMGILDSRYVLEGQSNSISNAMLQNNAVTSDKIASNSVRLDELDTSSVDSRYVNRGGDTMIGNLNMGGNRIRNVGAPVNNNDVATRGYVDTQIAANVPNCQLETVNLGGSGCIPVGVLAPTSCPSGYLFTGHQVGGECTFGSESSGGGNLYRTICSRVVCS